MDLDPESFFFFLLLFGYEDHFCFQPQEKDVMSWNVIDELL